VTSHRGLGSHGPEGARQAGMPGVEPAGLVRPTAKGRRGSRMSPALLGQKIWDRPNGRQTPDGRALEAFVLSTNSCALQLPARLPTYSTARLRKQGVAATRHVRPQAEPATAGRR